EGQTRQDPLRHPLPSRPLGRSDTDRRPDRRAPRAPRRQLLAVPCSRAGSRYRRKPLGRRRRPPAPGAATGARRHGIARRGELLLAAQEDQVRISMGKVTIGRALLSVSDKSGLADLGSKLAKAGVELISTGGTARALREAG